MIWNNRKFVIFGALISSLLFYSCQKKDPFVFLSNNSLSVGYINNPGKQGITSFETDYLAGKTQDTLNFLIKYLPELKNKDNYSVFFSHLPMNSYNFVINCSGFGSEILKKIRTEKDIPNFRFKEIFSEGLLFISPFDDDLVICSNRMDEIKASVKRGEKNNIRSNTQFNETEKKYEENTAFWFIVFDSLQIRNLLFPLHSGTEDSFFIKNLNLFSNLVVAKAANGSSTIEISSRPVGTEGITEIENRFNLSKNVLDFSSLAREYTYFHFKKISFVNNNQTFKIIIE